MAVIGHVALLQLIA